MVLTSFLLALEYCQNVQEVTYSTIHSLYYYHSNYNTSITTAASDADNLFASNCLFFKDFSSTALISVYSYIKNTQPQYFMNYKNG